MSSASGMSQVQVVGLSARPARACPSSRVGSARSQTNRPLPGPRQPRQGTRLLPSSLSIWFGRRWHAASQGRAQLRTQPVHLVDQRDPVGA